MSKLKRGLGLFSGGLDSMLAAAVLRAQGLEVTGIFFTTPFFGPDRARQSAAHLQLPLIVADITDKFFPLIYDPPRGFGKGHNPCIDCHLLMLREAAALMETEGFDFLFTGEVLGQRPMSQNRGSLNLIARESGVAELLLRPLSAKLLTPTQPELLGWVDREKLLDLSGRGRKRQMALAVASGITNYPAPAGGCLLTDPGYAARLKETLRHQGEVSRRDLELLKWGRHFRLPRGSKAVVGRTQRDNEALEGLIEAGDLVLKVVGYPGPLVLVIGHPSTGDLQEAAGLAAAYSDAAIETQVAVAVQGGPEPSRFHLTAPPKARFKEWLV
ncbi:MAG: tRNA 4-thiouridine(8) synthase ThiI [Thermodesulfobacteriota bacterium]